MAAVCAHGVDLLLFVAVGKESQLFAVGRPARQEIGLCGVGELPDRAGLLLVNPNVSGTAFSLRRLRDHKGQPVAVRRELQVGNTMQVQGSFGSQQLGRTGLERLLSKYGRAESRKSKQSASRNRTIHQSYHPLI